MTKNMEASAVSLSTHPLRSTTPAIHRAGLPYPPKHPILPPRCPRPTSEPRSTQHRDSRGLRSAGVLLERREERPCVQGMLDGHPGRCGASSRQWDGTLPQPQHSAAAGAVLTRSEGARDTVLVAGVVVCLESAEQASVHRLSCTVVHTAALGCCTRRTASTEWPTRGCTLFWPTMRKSQERR